MAAWTTLLSPGGWVMAGSVAAIVGVFFLLMGSIAGNRANEAAHDGLADQIENVQAGQEALQANVQAVQAGQEALQANVQAVQAGQEALQADVRTLVQVISGGGRQQAGGGGSPTVNQPGND